MDWAAKLRARMVSRHCFYQWMAYKNLKVIQYGIYAQLLQVEAAHAFTVLKERTAVSKVWN